MGRGFTEDGLAALDRTLEEHARGDDAPGMAWLVTRGDEVYVGAAGSIDGAGRVPVAPDTIFRISSVTKPVAAVAALTLVDDGTVALDDPVDELLPELADRQVIIRDDVSLDETVPAERPITLRDLLTFRSGWGFDFAATSPQTVLGAMAERGLGLGPPAPAQHLPVDEWLARLSTLPLQHQPGERWLYQASAEILGPYVARATGRTLGAVMQERIFEPLGMVDTGFSVPAGDLDRFGPCFWSAEGPVPGVDDEVAHGDPSGRTIYDPVEGQWSAPPPFEDGGAGLVSTVEDLRRFGALLLGHGALDGQRVLSAELVKAMTSDQLTTANKAVSGPDPSGASSWGFGIGVQIEPSATRAVGSYGWDGGLGSTWGNDPATGVTASLLTNVAWTSPNPPPVTDAFWASVTAAVAG